MIDDFDRITRELELELEILYPPPPPTEPVGERGQWVGHLLALLLVIASMLVLWALIAFAAWAVPAARSAWAEAPIGVQLLWKDSRS